MKFLSWYQDKNMDFINFLNKILFEREDREIRYPNGLIFIQETFYQDKLEGERKIYYNNGNLFLSESYRNGKLHGKLTEHWPSGIVKLREKYLNGELQPGRKMWDKNGKPY